MHRYLRHSFAVSWSLMVYIFLQHSWNRKDMKSWGGNIYYISLTKNSMHRKKFGKRNPITGMRTLCANKKTRRKYKPPTKAHRKAQAISTRRRPDREHCHDRDSDSDSDYGYDSHRRARRGDDGDYRWDECDGVDYSVLGFPPRWGNYPHRPYMYEYPHLEYNQQMPYITHPIYVQYM